MDLFPFKVIGGIVALAAFFSFMPSVFERFDRWVARRAGRKRANELARGTRRPRTIHTGLERCALCHRSFLSEYEGACVKKEWFCEPCYVRLLNEAEGLPNVIQFPRKGR